MREVEVPSVERSPGSFLFDLLRAAGAAGVVADRRHVAEGIAPFADRFCSKPTEIRTTSLSEAKREVSFRFVDEQARGEVFELARDWFRLSDQGATFMSAVHQAFPLRGEGIDADVRTGFRKVWAFLSEGFRLDRFTELPGAPGALRDVAGVLTRFGLQHMSIVGTDHHRATCNLYPIIAPGWGNATRVAELAAALGFPAMNPAWLDKIDRAVAANFTFSWDSGEPLRLAIYWPGMSLDDVPDDPLLRTFAEHCPVIAKQRAFISSVAYARGGDYRKLEVDYDGQMVGVFVRCAMVPAER
jgi:hypothetical protein